MDLLITGCGAISSLGRTTATVAAAVRAGLAMPREISWFSVLDDETQTRRPLIGHPVQGYTEGFSSLGRLLRLAEGCARGLQEESQSPDFTDMVFWGRTGLFFVGPPLDDARFEEAEGDVVALKAAFLRQLRRLLAMPARDQMLQFFDLGPAGVAAAALLAQERFARGEIERALIIAVDSYLDVASIEWLVDHGCLRIPGNPVGVAPGEAGIALLVETPRAVATRRAKCLAVIESAAVDFDDADSQARSSPDGRVLSHVIRALPINHFDGDVIVDLDGDPRRAANWGLAQVACRDFISDNSTIVLPCGSVGHIGAASAALAIVLSVQAFLRGYATRDRTVIVATSSSGHAGALVVRAPR